MADSGLWGGVATAAINQTGNIISTAMANSANERMQHEQNAWNLQQWKIMLRKILTTTVFPYLG